MRKRARPTSSCLQVRAMQIIDELEVNRRGPYGGGIGHVGFNGSMDMALALRTMIIPNPPSQRARADNGSSAAAAANGSEGRPATPDRKDWVIHLQVGRWRFHMLLDGIKPVACCLAVRNAWLGCSSTPVRNKKGIM